MAGFWLTDNEGSGFKLGSPVVTSQRKQHQPLVRSGRQRDIWIESERRVVNWLGEWNNDNQRQSSTKRGIVEDCPFFFWSFGGLKFEVWNLEETTQKEEERTERQPDESGRPSKLPALPAVLPANSITASLLFYLYFSVAVTLPFICSFNPFFT